MNKYLWITILIICIPICAIPNLPGNEELIKKFPIKYQIGISIGVVVAGIIISLLTTTLPKDDITIETPPVISPSLNAAMDDRLEILRKSLEKYNYEISVNVMVVKKRWFCWGRPIFPGTNFLWPCLYEYFFDSYWSRGSGVPDELNLTIKQGVSGMAFFDGTGTTASEVKCVVLRSKTGRTKEKFGMSKKQLEITDGLVVIASCPIMPRRLRNGKEIMLRCGVLNFHCKTKGSNKLFEKEERRDAFKPILAQMAQKFEEYYP